MKVLVAVKRVVDYNVKVRVKADNSGVAEKSKLGNKFLGGRRSAAKVSLYAVGTPPGSLFAIISSLNQTIQFQPLISSSSNLLITCADLMHFLDLN